MSEELQSAQPQAEVSESINTDVVSQNEPTTTQEDTTSVEPQKIKIKYNHEEKEIPYEEAVQHIQKGMNYDKAIERARQEARDSYFAEQKFEWMGKPITTEAEYNQALKEKDLYEKLQNQQLPEEVINELVESRREREERQSEKKALEMKSKKDAEYQEFFDYFAKENGRSFDPQQDTISEEVWVSTHKGKSLLDAYQSNEAKVYKQKIKELESKLNIQNVNDSNSKSSTGSLSNDGNSSNGYFSKAQVEKMSQKEISNNLEAIEKSMKKW